MRNAIVPTVAPRSRQEMERLAEEVLRRSFPGHLREPEELDVIELFDVLRDDYGFDMSVAQLPDAIEGVAWPNGRIEIDEETYRAAAKGDGRARFTICHETGHALLHVREIKDVYIDSGQVLLYRRSDVPAYRDPEWQANAFASALLMPSAMVTRLLMGRRFDLFSSRELLMMNTFGVSHAAAETRLKVLQIK